MSPERQPELAAAPAAATATSTGPATATSPELGGDGPAKPPRGAHAMAIFRWILVGAVAIVATGSILSYAGVHLGGHPTAATAQLYTCPMHPSIVQDHPGQCPICSMTLVPKLASEGKAARAAAADAPGDLPPGPAVPGLAPIDLTPARIQLIGMRTAIVKRTTLTGELRTVGVVTASERGLAQVPIRFTGWIEKLMVSDTGARVKRGQLLATVYSPDVLKAEQELLVTRGWSGKPAGGAEDPHAPDIVATGFGASARRRLELLGISAADIDEILRTGTPIPAISILSPIDGYVLAKNAVVGLAVAPGTVLFQIADLSTVWVTADIYEVDMPHVRVGQSARFELASSPGRRARGKVKFIYPVVNSQSRTLTVRLELSNQIDRNGPALRPGMYGTVVLELPATAGLTVPAEAVVDTGDVRYLFVAKEGGRFEPRRVEVGAHQQDSVEILTGVSEGETVVTTGNFLIDSESRLRFAIEGQGATDDGPAGAATGTSASGSTCGAEIDRQRFPEKFSACRACEIQHRGMGSMEDDCKNLIPRPWK